LAESSAVAAAAVVEVKEPATPPMESVVVTEAPGVAEAM